MLCKQPPATISSANNELVARPTPLGAGDDVACTHAHNHVPLSHICALPPPQAMVQRTNDHWRWYHSAGRLCAAAAQQSGAGGPLRPGGGPSAGRRGPIMARRGPQCGQEGPQRGQEGGPVQPDGCPSAPVRAGGGPSATQEGAPVQPCHWLGSTIARISASGIGTRDFGAATGIFGTPASGACAASGGAGAAAGGVGGTTGGRSCPCRACRRTGAWASWSV